MYRAINLLRFVLSATIPDLIPPSTVKSVEGFSSNTRFIALSV
nr:MAG TPA: hypothetical protein [Caudoviricetes sp.]